MQCDTVRALAVQQYKQERERDLDRVRRPQVRDRRPGQATSSLDYADAAACAFGAPAARPPAVSAAASGAAASARSSVIGNARCGRTSCWNTRFVASMPCETDVQSVTCPRLRLGFETPELGTMAAGHVSLTSVLAQRRRAHRTVRRSPPQKRKHGSRASPVSQRPSRSPPRRPSPGTSTTRSSRHPDPAPPAT